MSIGNLKTSGNKGNNFPWQFKMLKGLQDLYDTNFESAIVVVICGSPFPPSCPTYTSYLEIRTWSQITKKCGNVEHVLDPPIYFLPGTTNPLTAADITTLGCTIVYSDDSTLLCQALECCAANGVILSNILTTLNSQVKIPILERPNNTSGSITVVIKSISFACPTITTLPSSISTDGGLTFVEIYPGETVHYDAGVLNNFFVANIFMYDTTNSELLISYIV